jgi:hypothetical protein
MNEQEIKKTILLVEDEALIAVIEKETLKKHGFNVILASSGEKAIEIARTSPPYQSHPYGYQPRERKDGWYGGGRDHLQGKRYSHSFPVKLYPAGSS